MPTYEYACASCGNAWEEIQKITEPPVEECPSCHKPTAKRQISGGSFILKGGGWYADLYSSKGGSKPADSSAKSSGDGGDAKSETKTETKTETKKDGGSGAGGGGTSGSGGSPSGGSSKAAAE